jgi:predicted nucleotidyltransferase
METSQLQIMEKLKSDEFTALACKMKIDSVLVFGSVLTEEFNENSDVDIAILSKAKLSLPHILNIELFLEELLNRPVDVVDINSDKLDIFIKISILNNGQCIYTSDDNVYLIKVIDETERYYRENENYFYYRRMDLLS